jgi:PilZ domain
MGNNPCPSRWIWCKRAKILENVADIVGMSHKRTQPRKIQICRICIYWKDQDGLPKVQSGLVEDRSLSGLGITVPDPIPIGTKVQVRGRAKELLGSVRHCRAKGINYLIGIRLDDEDADWNRSFAGI